MDATLNKILMTMMEILNEIMEQVTEQTEILKTIKESLESR